MLHDFGQELRQHAQQHVAGGAPFGTVPDRPQLHERLEHPEGIRRIAELAAGTDRGGGGE